MLRKLSNISFKSVLFITIFSNISTYAETQTILTANAETAEKVAIKKIHDSLHSSNYRLLGTYLKEHVGKTVSFNTVLEIASQQNASSLLHALAATQKIELPESNASFTRNDFLQTALFIESSLHNFVKRKQYYLKKEQTSLTCALEYDSVTKKVFIVLPHTRENDLGHGANKIVTKAILYDRNSPEFVARSLQTKVKKREIKMAHILQNRRGLVDVIACTKYNEGKKAYRVIYAKLYSPGSLYSFLNKGKQLSSTEKKKVTLDLLSGLTELHKKNIAHRDVSTRNCLINISKENNGQPTVQAVLCDLGRSDFVRKQFPKRLYVQGHVAYTPPEGIFREKMKGDDYFYSDVYALGCVLYNIYYEKMPPWMDGEYVRNTELSASKRYTELVKSIQKFTESRRRELAQKTKTKSFTADEAFEYLILRMVDPNPKNRGSALQLQQEMRRIFNEFA